MSDTNKGRYTCAWCSARFERHGDWMLHCCPQRYMAESAAEKDAALGVAGGEAPAADSTTAVLTERGKRYGPFIGHAHVTQDLKAVLRKHLHARNRKLQEDQQEALEMIFHKIGRIVNGDPDYDDSWVDIAGYARLVADRLQGTTR